VALSCAQPRKSSDLTNLKLVPSITLPAERW
jgi:hypothetical protein